MAGSRQVHVRVGEFESPGPYRQVIPTHMMKFASIEAPYCPSANDENMNRLLLRSHARI